jgi:hypothetical protein
MFCCCSDDEEIDIYCPNCGKKGHHVDFSITGDESQCQCPKYEAFMKYPNRKFSRKYFFFFSNRCIIRNISLPGTISNPLILLENSFEGFGLLRLGWRAPAAMYECTARRRARHATISVLAAAKTTSESLVVLSAAIHVVAWLLAVIVCGGATFFFCSRLG